MIINTSKSKAIVLDQKTVVYPLKLLTPEEELKYLGVLFRCDKMLRQSDLCLRGWLVTKQCRE